MNFRAMYHDGMDKTISAQDMAEAQEKAALAHPAKLFTISPKITNEECLRVLKGIELRFSEALKANLQGEERNSGLRLLLREVHTLRNDYWLDIKRDDAPRAIDKVNQLSNKIFEAFV